MDIPTPVPQVVVRGEAMLVVDPEIAELGVTVTGRARDRRGDGDPVASLHTRLVVGRLEVLGDLVVALGRLDDVAVTGPWWRLRPESAALEQARLAAVRDAVRRARQYAAAFGAELTALLEVSDTGLAGGVRFANAAAEVAPFGDGELRLDLAPARQEVHGAVEVRFAMSAPDQEVFRP